MVSRTGSIPKRSAATPARNIAAGGVIVRIASLGDIVASKQYAARPKDLEALPELLELMEGLEAD